MLASEISGALTDRNDITGRNPLRVTDLFLKRCNNVIWKIGTEEKISKMTDKMWMRINIRTSAAISLE